MNSPTFRWPRLTAGLFGLAALLLGSCASDERPHRGALSKPPAPVAGEGTYFDGQLVATIRIGAEFHRPDGGGDESGRPGREGGRRGGGAGFGGGAGPMRGGGAGGRGGRHGDGERPEGPGGEFGGGGPRPMPARGLPLMIHIRLHNTGSAAVEVASPDFASPLGNFVVQPATLTIPAGESAEVSPMTSFVQGDLPDEMPATLVLRVAGHSEKQVIVLRPVPRNKPTPSDPDPESRPTRN